MPYRKGRKTHRSLPTSLPKLLSLWCLFPINGDNLTLEMPYCNTVCFQIFIDKLSVQKPEEFKIILLDNGAFHHSRQLVIPKNIHLLFIPPYSPELNPAEMIWRFIKGKTANIICKDLEELSAKVTDIINDMSNVIIQSITGWKLFTNCAF
ncbi:MAG: transposase [Sphingobacteriales bacterium]|nr:transposase [Sphingobacteriales bacterium]MBK8444178.1 transposase [Sphingobacteriales bacterium]